MAAFILFGNFCLAGGVRKPTSKKNASNGAPINVYHTYYDTTLTTPTGPIQAQLRVYSSGAAPPLSDDTVVFAVTRAHVSQRLPVFLEAQAVYPYPGDANEQTYEDSVPDLSFTMFIGAGPSRTPNSRHEIASDGRSRAFSLELSDYVRDGLHTSAVQCVYIAYSFPALCSNI
jgi:hypothetical protein